LVSRFLDEYSRPASLALMGSFTTNERHSRPAGAIWKGKLELRPALTSALADPGQVDRGDRQLPRLNYAGFYQVRNLEGQSTALLAVNLFLHGRRPTSSNRRGPLFQQRRDGSRTFRRTAAAPVP
jgi:hypothetical protein